MNNSVIIGAMSEHATANNSMELGKLRSDIRIELHTREAAQLFTKKQDEFSGEDKKYVPHNLSMLAQSMMILEGDIKLDNPYADYWFDMLWSNISEFRAELTERKKELLEYMKERVPSNFITSEAYSQKPITYQIRSGSQLYFQYLYAVLEIDAFVRLVMLANHVALITPMTKAAYTYDVMRRFRAMISRAASYRHSPVTRDDVAANNERARIALERYTAIGIQPTEEHFNGTKRHDFAPVIHSVSDRKENPQAAYIEPEVILATEQEEMTDA